MPEMFDETKKWDNFEILFCTFYFQNAVYMILIVSLLFENVTRHCPKLSKTYCSINCEYQKGIEKVKVIVK